MTGRRTLTKSALASALRTLPPAPKVGCRPRRSCLSGVWSQAQIVARATADAEFRAALIADLESALAQEGYEPDERLLEELRERVGARVTSPRASESARGVPRLSRSDPQGPARRAGHGRACPRQRCRVGPHRGRPALLAGAARASRSSCPRRAALPLRQPCSAPARSSSPPTAATLTRGRSPCSRAHPERRPRSATWPSPTRCPTRRAPARHRTGRSRRRRPRRDARRTRRSDHGRRRLRGGTTCPGQPEQPRASSRST